MNVTDLITDRMHDNLKPRDINEFEKYRWLVEMIAVEYAQEQVKNCSIPLVSECVTWTTDEVLNIIEENEHLDDLRMFFTEHGR